MALGCSECDDDEREVDGFDEDCGDVGEGILKLYPSRWAPICYASSEYTNEIPLI